MDNVSPDVRSRIMSKIRSRGTKIEILVAEAVTAAGHETILQDKTLPGRPDISVPSRKAAIFVHGCFWHRHGCGNSKMPENNADFWKAKFERNVKRDADAKASLLRAGWRVAIVWECSLRKDPETALTKLGEWLAGDDPVFTVP